MKRIDVQTPVIIAAYQEERLIGSTLDSIRSAPVDPIVAINGPKDRTADIAYRMGATVLVMDEQGKLPALQEAVRFLRDECDYGADMPLLFLDGDSHPLFPRAWARLSIQALMDSAPEEPTVVSGPSGYFDGNVFVNAVRTGLRYKDSIRSRSQQSTNSVFGYNMGVKFGTDNVRDQFLALPHIWPGEDRVTADLIISSSPEDNHTQLLDLRGLVVTSARYNVPFLYRLTHSKAKTRNRVLENYARRAAPTSVPRSATQL